MKKAMNIKQLTMALATIFAMGFTQTAFAQNESRAEFKFVGSVESHPVFELKLDNADGDEFYLSIKDAYSGLLYSAKLTGVNISKRYRLDIEEEDLSNVRFEIKSKKTNKNMVYQISKSIRTVESVLVAKL
jgi:phosphoribosylformylglycinamidine (FGAM) synthase PurS component